MAHDGHMKPEHRAARQLREGGYTRAKDGNIHGDHAQDASMVRKAISQHDAQLHSPGKSHDGKTRLKLRSGGMVTGHKPKQRPDRRARGGDVNDMRGRDLPNDAGGNVNEHSARAKGGSVGKKGRVIINIRSGGQQDQQQLQAAHQAGIQQGTMLGARAAAAKMAGGAPGGPPPGAPPGGMPPGPGARPMMPPPGAPPGGGMPPRPPGPMARGGPLRGPDGRFTGGAVA